MKKATLILGIATLFTVGSVAFTGCGGSGEKNEDTEQHEEMEGHQHEGMEGEMGGMSDIEITLCPKWQYGEHEHATYICPMWDEEGENNESGECYKCGMKLVKFEGVKKKHDMQPHAEEEHEMGSHEH